MDRLRIYRDELLKWNRKVNLIGPEAERNLDDHVAEAVEAAGLLQPFGEVLDFGSGGGLPAIPMAIVSPAARFHLVEADARKWAFLKHVVRECGLDAVLYAERLETAVKRFAPEKRFQLVTSRAVGRPEEWVPLLADHLERDARIALFQSGDSVEIPGFQLASATRLSRGDSNYLVTLKMFHVEHSR